MQSIPCQYGFSGNSPAGISHCYNSRVSNERPTKTPAAVVHRIVEHHFRRTSGQLVSTLTRVFGTGEIDRAESVVQEAFLKAIETWPYTGIPENPAGWLTTVARNHALDVIRREQRFRDKEAEVVHWLTAGRSDETSNLSGGGEIVDDQLRLFFICCHPSLPQKSQVALMLKTIGGFSVPEIARGLLSNEEAVRKLLTRAKEKIRQEDLPFVLPPVADLPGHLGFPEAYFGPVLWVLALTFSSIGISRACQLHAPRNVVAA